MVSKLDLAYCQDITGLKDFLRLSRTLVDDTITQNLNNLVLPPRFDPTSTTRSEKQVLRTPIDKTSCNTLLNTIFENWDARSSTIDYCIASVAPQTYERHDLTKEEIRARRLDPYSGRQNDDLPILKRVCDQEQATERIIRDRTWRIVRGRCDALTGMSDDWQVSFDAWRREKKQSPSMST